MADCVGEGVPISNTHHELIAQKSLNHLSMRGLERMSCLCYSGDVLLILYVNKLARIIWAVLANQTAFDPKQASA